MRYVNYPTDVKFLYVKLMPGKKKVKQMEKASIALTILIIYGMIVKLSSAFSHFLMRLN